MESDGNNTVVVFAMRIPQPEESKFSEHMVKILVLRMFLYGFSDAVFQNPQVWRLLLSFIICCYDSVDV